MRTIDVYGVSNSLIKTYIERPNVDNLFNSGLVKNKHIIIYALQNKVKLR